MKSIIKLSLFFVILLHKQTSNNAKRILKKDKNSKPNKKTNSNKNNITESKQNIFNKFPELQTQQYCPTLDSLTPSIDSNCWKYNDVDEDGIYLTDQKGCDNQLCQNSVCACDDYCCTTSWDIQCRVSKTCSARVLCCEPAGLDFYTSGIDSSFLISLSSSAEVTLLDLSILTTEALYFSNFKFGPLISPKGDCVQIYEGYIFIGWYRGGMDDRHVMLSRSKVGVNEWTHIEFPHQHIGFQGNITIGDSHNSIAVGVSPIDDSIHLLYDMHAYSKNKYPDDYFNYCYSVDGAALVNDENWNIALFYPKQNYLRAGSDYQRITYPAFMTTPSGLLVTKYRIGGHTYAKIVLNSYDGISWSAPKVWNKQPYNDKYGVYGGFSVRQGKFHMCFSRRTNEDINKGYRYNRGIYYASTKDESYESKWFNLNGEEKQSLPISSIDNLHLFDPSQPGDNYHAPNFILTQDESTHFIAKLIRNLKSHNVHYYKTKNETIFQESIIENTGNLRSVQGNFITTKNKIYLVTLHLGRPVIFMTNAGASDFQLVYYDPVGQVYGHAKTSVWIEGGKFFHLYLFALAINERSDRHPIEVLHFLLTDEES